MAHFAQIDENNNVIQVIVVSNNELLDNNGIEIEQNGINFCKSLFGENTNWVQTSYNNSFRKRYAGINYTYDLNRNAFIAPKPYNSWVLDETNCDWVSPITYPSDGLSYAWDEQNIVWDRIYGDWQPSSDNVIAKLLEIANLNASDTFLDLGCGDGRVLQAAINTGAKLIGIEIKQDLFEATKLLLPTANVFLQDFAYFDCSNASVIYGFVDVASLSYVLKKLITEKSKAKVIFRSEYIVDAWGDLNPTNIVEFDNMFMYLWDLNNL